MTRVCAFLIASAVLIAPDPGHARRATVDGWTISDEPEEDGGRLVVMEKAGKGWKLAHHAGLWRGNAGPYEGATFQWRGCSSGEADYRFDWAQPLTLHQLRGRFRDYFDECAVPEANRDKILRGLPRAYATFRAWVGRERSRL